MLSTIEPESKGAGERTRRNQRRISMSFEKTLRYSAIPFAWACWAWVWYGGAWIWLPISVIPYLISNSFETIKGWFGRPPRG